MSAIHCNEAVERVVDEIARLKMEVKPSAASTDIRTSQGAKKETTAEVGKENVAVAEEEVIANEENEIDDLKSGGFDPMAVLFAAQGAKFGKQKNKPTKNAAVAEEEVAANVEETNHLDQIHHSSIAVMFATQGAKFKKPENKQESQSKKDYAENEDMGVI